MLTGGSQPEECASFSDRKSQLKLQPSSSIPKDESVSPPPFLGKIPDLNTLPNKITPYVSSVSGGGLSVCRSRGQSSLLLGRRVSALDTKGAHSYGCKELSNSESTAQTAPIFRSVFKSHSPVFLMEGSPACMT